jgi:hypothetical protein
MHRVGRSQPSFVVSLAALGWEFLRLAPIQLGEGVNDGIALRKKHRLRNRLEESAAHDLEALFGSCWPPGRFDPAHNIPEALKGCASALSTNLDVRSRNANDQQRFGNGGCSLRQGLRECEVGVKRPCR